MRQIHRAGEKLFIDYAGQTVGYGDEGDRAQIFVAVLGASNYIFSCATSHQRLKDWTGAIVRAFEFFDGVTQLVVPDNARAMIADPDRYEPGASATIADLANEYGTVVLPARPLRPRDKGKLDVAVQVVERWILASLRDRRFATVGEVDVSIGELLEDLNNRPFKRLPGLYHYVSAGTTNCFDYARFVIRWARANGLPVKVPDDAIRPIATSDYPTLAKRPLNSRLSTRKLRDTFSIHLPEWQIGVERMLRETFKASESRK